MKKIALGLVTAAAAFTAVPAMAQIGFYAGPGGVGVGVGVPRALLRLRLLRLWPTLLRLLLRQPDRGVRRWIFRLRSLFAVLLSQHPTRPALMD
jgi:hypothetical protein